jgi:uncharacterized protein (TIGR02646 family)
MMKLNRPPAPEFLQRYYKKWGREFAEKRKNNPTYTFNWKMYKGKRVDQFLRQILDDMNRSHCTFCDSYPLGPSAEQTIEHFRPKSKYPRLAYVWHNLFLACNVCQKAKGEQFDKKLLKPDTEDYQFDTYFIVNYKTGKIEVNSSANFESQERAAMTIRMYGLNNYGRPHSRLRERKKYQELSSKEYRLDDFSYRFFVE